MARQRRQTRGKSSANTRGYEAGAVLSGARDLVMDVPRYGLLTANAAARMFGAYDKPTAARVADSINYSADNPIFLPEQYNDFLNYSRQKRPDLNMGGQMLTGGGAAALFRRKIPNHPHPKAVKGLFGAPTLPAGLFFQGAAVAPIKETYVEPKFYDPALNYYRE